MNTAKIKSFEIIGLFGTHDVSIPFDGDTKILIGENGVGKTQVLNLLYYYLTKNFFKLEEYDFRQLTISFLDNFSVTLNKKDLQHKVNIEDEKRVNTKYSLFPSLQGLLGHKYKRKIKKYEYPKLNPLQKDIEKRLKSSEILYFPTYRRVEEDLYNLGYADDELEVDQESNLIQFGMDDVKRRFKYIENTIDKLLKEGLAQFTKDILTVVIDEAEPNNSILEKIDENDLEIILSRVGDQIPDAQKNAVKNAIKNNEIKNPLSAYLLQKLVEIYEKQKELDDSVKLFRNVCNKYLINKKVFYDESAIEIYIKSEITGEPIDLKHLSSGEKQIISMFSKVYLSDSEQKFMILFDEPELSLSMKWQRQLLPDLMDSNKCEFLLAVTHSPFIFDNKLDQYAVGINEYISFTQTATQA